MRVRNMESAKGNATPRQFIIEDEGHGANGNFRLRQTFQSYDSVIATITEWQDGRRDVELDEKYWDYSVTTGKFRNIFLGEKKAETEKKIKSGEYKLANLNKG